MEEKKETTNQKYVYMDEASIDKELICSICYSPFDNPCCAPCGETFCRACIIQWIQTQNRSCPHCRQTLSIDVLTQAPRPLQNMLARLPVQCIDCKQTKLQRDSIDDHIRNACPKAVVLCSSADIKCPWRGERNQLNQHLTICHFEALKPVINEFITENQQLKYRVNLQAVRLTTQQDTIRHLKQEVNRQTVRADGQQNENQQLKTERDQSMVQLVEQQATIQEFGEKIQQQQTELNKYKNENEKLIAQIARLSTQINLSPLEGQQFQEPLRGKGARVTSINRQSG